MRWTIWDEMQRMQQEMDDMMRSFGTERKLLPGPSNIPARSEYRQPLADIWETDDSVVATIELPGIEKEDIEIELLDDSLEVKVEKKQGKEEKHKGGYRIERSYAGFYRRFSLPSKVIGEKAEATYKSGVLEIKAPKLKDDKDKPRRIKVQ